MELLMTTKYLKPALVTIISVLISLVLSEILLRGFSYLRQNYDVEMWHYANFLKQPVMDERSHIHRNNSFARIMGKDSTINSQGLRDKEFSYDKPKLTYRILSIGDSYTFGFGATQNQVFSKLLEKKLANKIIDKNIEVLNMGVGNYNTKQELAALKIEGLKYHPDHILWNFYINDAEETQKLNPTFLSTHFIALVYFKSFLYKLKASLVPQKNYVDFYLTTFEGESGKKFYKQLDELINLCLRNNIKLTVTLLPDFKKLAPYPFQSVHAQIKNYFISKGVNVIDTVEAFAPQKEKNYWVAHDDPHPNDKAHAIIAQKIFQELKL